MINQNSAVSQEIRDVLKLQGAINPIPRNVDDRIIPVIDINPKHAQKIEIIKSASGGTALSYTTPADMDFYLTNAALGYAKAAADTGTFMRIRAYVNGAQLNILGLVGITGTAENKETEEYYGQIGIKIDRNTVIDSSESGTFTTGWKSIKGFIDYQSKA